MRRAGAAIAEYRRLNPYASGDIPLTFTSVEEAPTFGRSSYLSPASRPWPSSFFVRRRGNRPISPSAPMYYNDNTISFDAVARAGEFPFRREEHRPSTQETKIKNCAKEVTYCKYFLRKIVTTHALLYKKMRSGISVLFNGATLNCGAEYDA